MAPDSVWEIVFLMVILKIPIVYLCSVIYWAIKAEPEPETPVGVTVEVGPDPDDGGPGRRRRRFPRPRPLRPHGNRPSRTYPRTPQTAHAKKGERS
jgi:hypothetical protein